MLTIYQWEPNANSGKPLLAACEKGIEFESKHVDMLGFEQHAPEYLQINRNGTCRNPWPSLFMQRDRASSHRSRSRATPCAAAPEP